MFLVPNVGFAHYCRHKYSQAFSNITGNNFGLSSFENVNKNRGGCTGSRGGRGGTGSRGGRGGTGNRGGREEKEKRGGKGNQKRPQKKIIINNLFNNFLIDF